MSLPSSLRNPSHLHLLAAIDPNLYSDDAESRSRLSKSVIDIRAQRVKRKPALQVPFGARDLGAIQPSRHANLDPLRAKPLSVLDRSPHRSPESDSLLELLRDLLSLKLCVKLGLMDLLNVDVNFAPGAVFDFFFELVDLGPFASDDYAGSRSVDDYLQLVGRTLDVDVRDARARKPTLQFLLQLQVFVQQVGVVTLGNPV